MTPSPASRPDCRTLTTFLCDITGSGSPPQTGLRRTPDSPADSDLLTGLRSGSGESGYVLSPAVRREPGNDRALAELTLLVDEMADNLDRAIAAGGDLPFSGEQLREYFREALRVFGVEAALAEARIRYWAQVECQVMPLPKSRASA